MKELQELAPPAHPTMLTATEMAAACSAGQAQQIVSYSSHPTTNTPCCFQNCLESLQDFSSPQYYVPPQCFLPYKEGSITSTAGPKERSSPGMSSRTVPKARQGAASKAPQANPCFFPLPTSFFTSWLKFWYLFRCALL